MAEQQQQQPQRPQRPQQQQQGGPPPPPPPPMDMLTAMINLILIQTGKVFRDPMKLNSRNLIHTKSQVNTYIPGALSEFHAALDLLEIEVIQAKEVFIRDLAVSRARRAIREREAAKAAAAEKDRIAAEEASARAAEYTQEAQQHLEGDSKDIEETKQENVDVIMADGPLGTQDIGTDDFSVAANPATDSKDSNGSSVSPTKAPKPPPLDLSETAAPDTKSATNDADDPITATEAPLASEPAHQTPSTAGYNRMDFESMFNDPSGEPGTDDMNFDLDSFGDATGDHDYLGHDSMTTHNESSMDDSRAQPTTGNEDVSALLPGLETYANAEDDTTMFGNTTNSSALPPATTAKQTMSSVTNPSADLLQTESSFNDLFFQSMDDLDTGDGTGNGEDGNFNSEFDDLFMGMGND